MRVLDSLADQPSLDIHTLLGRKHALRVWINDPAMLATEGPKHRRVRSAPPDQLCRCKTVARYASAPRVGAPPQASGLSRL
jgi:hypothetical protein